MRHARRPGASPDRRARSKGERPQDRLKAAWTCYRGGGQMRPHRLSAITPRAAVFIAPALLAAAILLAFQHDRMLNAEKIRTTFVPAEILAARAPPPPALSAP